LSSLRGGSARNAIPASCVARAAMLDEAGFSQAFAAEADAIREEFHRIEPGLRIGTAQIGAGPVSSLTPESQRSFVLALQAVVNGVYRMSPEVPGLVEASSNLSLIELGGGRSEWSGLQRSSVESSKRDVAAAFSAPFLLLGAKVRHDDGYPGWSPSSSSPILDTMKGIYRELFGHEVRVGACHAGLECGVIAQAYPDLDMISFGPNIVEAHSENERAEIASVQKFWRLLSAVLGRL
jgi:dipeptidase D